MWSENKEVESCGRDADGIWEDTRFGRIL
jgi:hypothetical protein